MSSSVLPTPSTVSFDFSKSAVFIVMLVVLVVRPSGLFGTKELSRV